jgi:undecaprenyl-diphosphatase
MASIDTELFLWINHVWAATWLDDIMLAISSRFVWAAVALGTILWGLVRRNGRLLSIVLAVGVAIGLADLITYQVLKPTFKRLRPCHYLTDVRVVQERCGGDFGFPSNHAANSAATVAAMAVLLRDRRRVGVFAAVAGLVGLSRSYLGVHYPGDVMAGFVVGGLIGTAAGLAARRLLARWLSQSS